LNKDITDEKLADILRKRKKSSFLITNEMGKVLFESISEVEKSAANCDFYAENAEIMLKEEYYDTFKSMSVYDPMGLFCNNALNYPFKYCGMRLQ
jgi:succinate-semialdehyde dehydrogenase/glutarate-semialdehyde dehydrogenase